MAILSLITTSKEFTLHLELCQCGSIAQPSLGQPAWQHNLIQCTTGVMPAHTPVLSTASGNTNNLQLREGSGELSVGLSFFGSVPPAQVIALEPQ